MTIDIMQGLCIHTCESLLECHRQRFSLPLLLCSEQLSTAQAFCIELAPACLDVMQEAMHICKTAEGLEIGQQGQRVGNE